MLYLTYNDSPSGIYSSQVIDVCRFLNERCDVRVRLIALLSVRHFFRERKKIKKEFPEAIVFPMFPKIRFWKMNIISLIILLLFFPAQKIIARGIFATCFALILKRMGFVKKVIYDGRGAIAAEVNEYGVITSSYVRNSIFNLEKKAVLKSDFRIAVSHHLVNYWQNQFNYAGKEHFVIPCTLHQCFTQPFPSVEELTELRKKFSFNEKEVVLVFSGSSAGWQSNTMINDFLGKALLQYENLKVIILAKEDFALDIARKFPQRIKQMWLPHNQVREVLLSADYGLLLREQTITNRVSSPVKFAEYLSCGLKIIISDNVGDSSDFVREHRCGHVVNTLTQIPPLSPVLYTQKLHLHKLAVENFSKEKFVHQYQQL